MDMDRNINRDGSGKYILVNNRKARQLRALAADTRDAKLVEDACALNDALNTLERIGVLEWGAVGEASEFFLIKLRDRNAVPALMAYAESIGHIDPRFALQVRDMASRAGSFSPFCKDPD